MVLRGHCRALGQREDPQLPHHLRARGRVGAVEGDLAGAVVLEAGDVPLPDVQVHERVGTEPVVSGRQVGLGPVRRHALELGCVVGQVAAAQDDRHVGRVRARDPPALGGALGGARHRDVEVLPGGERNPVERPGGDRDGVRVVGVVVVVERENLSGVQLAEDPVGIQASRRDDEVAHVRRGRDSESGVALGHPAQTDLVDTGAGIRIADHVGCLQIAVLALSTVATRLPLLREAEICKGTGHKNAQPTRPERNAQAADLHRPSKDDPQQMRYRHDEKQRGGDRHIGFSVQSACLSASRPTTGDFYAAGQLGHPFSTYRLMTYLPFRFRALRAA